MHGLCLQRDFGPLTTQPLSSNLHRAAIIQRHLSYAFGLLVSPRFPPVANRVDLPVSSTVEFWVAGSCGPTPPPPLIECIQISLSEIRSSYVKNKSKQTSKGSDEEGCCMRRLQPALSTGPATDAPIIVFNSSLPPHPLPPPPGSSRPPAPQKWV